MQRGQAAVSQQGQVGPSTFGARLKLAAVVLACSLATLVSAMVLLSRQSQMVQGIIRHQTRPVAWQAELPAVRVGLLEAEAGARGYLASHDAAFLQQYQAARQTLPAALQTLAGAASVNPTLTPILNDIRRLVGLKLAELDEVVRLAQAGDTPAALALVKADSSVSLEARLRSQVGAVAEAVRAHHNTSVAEVVAGSLESQRLASVALGVLLLAVVLAAWQITKMTAAQERNERALALSEQRHRAIVEDQTEFIALSHPDGSLFYVNPAYGRFFDVLPEELTGRGLYDAVIDSDVAVLREGIGAVLATGDPMSIEVRVTVDGGQKKWVAWRHRLQQAADGGAVVHSVGREITLRKTAEDNLRASQDFLSRTGRVAGIGGWELDLRTGRLYWSEQVKRIHEVADDYQPTLDNAVGYYTPESQELIGAAVEAGRLTGKPWDLELSLVTAKGRSIYVRAVGDVEFDTEGTPIRLVGALQDITHRKTLEQRLEARENFIRAVTDNIPVRLTYFDSQQRFQFVNRAVCESLGRGRDEFLGHTLAEMCPDAPRAEMLRQLPLALEGSLRRFEYSAPNATLGVTSYVEAQFIPDLGPDGAVRGVFGVGMDISHLKCVERTLRDLTDVFDATTDLVAQADANGYLIYLNPSARRVLGLPLDQPLERRPFSDFLTPETNQRLVDEILPAVMRAGIWVGETAVMLPGGRSIPVNHMVISHRDADGHVARYSSIIRDISAAVMARKSLALQTATLQGIIEAMPAMVAVCDVELRIRLVNNSFERWRGKSRADLVGNSLEAAVGAWEYERSLPWIERALAGETVTFEKDYPMDQTLRYVELTYIPLHLADGTVDGFIGIAQDVTRDREENLRLQLLSEHCPLTGLLNRAGFEAFLNSRIAQNQGAQLAILYIDLDNFKPINDSHGHTAGDEVLQTFAVRLQGLVRPTDAVARLGGDEFAVALTGIRKLDDAALVADEIVNMAQQPVWVGALLLNIGASVGVAFNAEGRGGWRDLLRRADTMVYQAKRAGRGCRMLDTGGPQSDEHRAVRALRSR
jgi:diguanylate cyclase (GGDEF)-like protein/PAS domain S-box-containing protein